MAKKSTEANGVEITAGIFIVLVMILTFTGAIGIWTAAPVVTNGVLNVGLLLIHITGSLFMVAVNVVNILLMSRFIRRAIV